MLSGADGAIICSLGARVKHVLGDLERRLTVLTLLLQGTWTITGMLSCLVDWNCTCDIRDMTRLNVGHMNLLNRTLIIGWQLCSVSLMVAFMTLDLVSGELIMCLVLKLCRRRLATWNILLRWLTLLLVSSIPGLVLNVWCRLVPSVPVTA